MCSTKVSHISNKEIKKKSEQACFWSEENWECHLLFQKTFTMYFTVNLIFLGLYPNLTRLVVTELP